MSRLAPLDHETLTRLGVAGDAATQRWRELGFVPNSILIMARRPELVGAIQALAATLLGPTSTIDKSLRNLVMQMASRGAVCTYCMAHTANSASQAGVSDEKEAALWEYETSPLFTEAERAALRVAQLAAQVPNLVEDADFEALKSHYTDEQIVDIVAVIAFMGFFNRFNDTMATPLEVAPLAAGERFLASHNWTPGKHAE